MSILFRMHPHERPHRLPPERYLGEVTVAITCCIAGRRPAFRDAANVSLVLASLTAACEKEGVDVLLYCFMPDHLHAILRGRHQDSNLLNCMKRFKQSSGFQLKRLTPPEAWLGDYYDHVIRNSADFEEHCFYIIGNPVRVGITEDHLAYPFTGCGTMTLDDFLASL